MEFWRSTFLKLDWLVKQSFCMPRIFARVVASLPSEGPRSQWMCLSSTVVILCICEPIIHFTLATSKKEAAQNIHDDLAVSCASLTFKTFRSHRINSKTKTQNCPVFDNGTLQVGVILGNEQFHLFVFCSWRREKKNKPQNNVKGQMVGTGGARLEEVWAGDEAAGWRSEALPCHPAAHRHDVVSCTVGSGRLQLFSSRPKPKHV